MKVPRFQIAVGFPHDKNLPLSIGPSLLTLQRQMGGDIVPVTVPRDAPPNIPRMVYRYRDAVVQVALDRIDVNVAAPEHVVTDFGAAQRFASRRSSEMLAILLPSSSPHSWCGCIAEIELYPPDGEKKSRTELATMLFRRLTSGLVADQIGTFQFQFGGRQESFNVTYTVDAFEMRYLDIRQPPPAKDGFIDADSLTLGETGVTVKLDVNDKPAAQAGRKSAEEDLRAVLKKQREKSVTLLNDLNLEGLAE